MTVIKYSFGILFFLKMHNQIGNMSMNVFFKERIEKSAFSI